MMTLSSPITFCLHSDPELMLSHSNLPMRRVSFPDFFVWYQCGFSLLLEVPFLALEREQTGLLC